MGNKQSRSGYSQLPDSPKPRKIKIVVIGDSVGKSTLIRKFVSDKKLKSMAMRDKSAFAERVQAPWTTAEMNIYECRGPKIRLLFSFLLRKADVVFKVYDTTTPKTYNGVINKYSRTIKFKARNARVFLVGNKADVDVVDAEKGVFDILEMDSKHGRIKHVVVSAETGFNVERLFSIAVMDVFPEGTRSDIGRESVHRTVQAAYTVKEEHRTHMASYKMNTNPKGICLIINNREFDESDLPLESRLATRFGTDNDADALRQLFTSLNFDVRQRDNLTDTQMLREINLIAITEDHSEHSCFVCCILSHGSEKYEGSVYGSNCRDIAISSLTSPFQARSCPSLAGKPKLFFIQACQGDKLMKGQEVNVPDVVPTSVQQRREIIPDEADFLLMLSTCPGYVAVRHVIKGSHFIQELIATVRQQPGSSIMDIATAVSNRVAQKDFGGFCQVPCLRSTLRKIVRLT